MQTILMRSVKKVVYAFISAGTGAVTFALCKDLLSWRRNPWEPAIAAIAMCIGITSFFALLRLRAPATFYSLEAWAERRMKASSEARQSETPDQSR